MSDANPWLAEVEATLPRLLALFDSDPCSPTRGQGDRLYWAWKLKDFGNATFQGAAHGLARLLAAGLLPSWLPEHSVLGRIDALFSGARRLTRGNGSLEEAFPHESSFCVTALVAWDLLSAYTLVGDRVNESTRSEWLDTVAPMINFLDRADETHGIISNHLATAVAALVRWQDVSGQPGDARAQELLARILAHASQEGWFREYEGADPGYQTLALCYLSEVEVMRPHWGLGEYLERACVFLGYFAHPDGSFGGHYGSRETRIFYPAGIELLARRVPEAATLATTMRESVACRTTVCLSAVDESNLIPLFNAYCRAAQAVSEATPRTVAAELPCRTPDAWRRHFPEAGLLIDRRPGSYTVVSSFKGGAFAHFEEGLPARLASASLVRGGDGRHYSAQAQDAANTLMEGVDRLTISAELREFHHELPTPARFLVLRLMNLSVMRIPSVGEWVKRLLVRLLVTRRGRVIGTVERSIRFEPEFSFEDQLSGAATAWEYLPVTPIHSTLHMASRGYWQLGDDAL
jgi:hypothetical protein